MISMLKAIVSEMKRANDIKERELKLREEQWEDSKLSWYTKQDRYPPQFWIGATTTCCQEPQATNNFASGQRFGRW
jgi:hypothetical protein